MTEPTLKACCDKYLGLLDRLALIPVWDEDAYRAVRHEIRQNAEVMIKLIGKKPDGR